MVLFHRVLCSVHVQSSWRLAAVAPARPHLKDDWLHHVSNWTPVPREARGVP